MLGLYGITAGYSGHVVLRDVDLIVPAHSVVALLGPNGAGKTTLLRVASGIVAPTAGRMVLAGEDVLGCTTDELARRGLRHVPEGRGIFPGLSVRDNLRLQAAPGDTEAIDRAIAAFPKLGQRLAQTAGTLSGGEQQMLALAHAYVADAEVVLLDEVSMGLAPTIVDEIFEHLRALASSGRSLLLVEQYVARALELADYVYVLEKGRVRFAGEASELGESAILASYLGEAV